MAEEDKEDKEENVDVATVLVTIQRAVLFKIPPKPSTQGHSAESWPKDGIWAGRLKLLQTNTECFLQFEHSDKPGVYLKVVVNTHQSGDINAPQTIEPVVDSSRYFALTILKPNTTDQYFELGLGFEDRDDSAEFKTAMSEYERIKRSLAKATEELDKLATGDLSLHENEMLDIKPMKNKKTSKNSPNSNDDKGDTLFMPPPPTNEKKSKKLKNTKNDSTPNANDNATFDDDFSSFVSDTTSTQNTDNNTNNTNTNNNKKNNNNNQNDDWSSFDF